MCRPMPVLWFLLLLSCPLVPLFAQASFAGMSHDYVPEGKPKRQSRISTVEGCQAACGRKDDCKAYAFRTAKPACYFYSQVYMGGPRGIIYSSGLSVVTKIGYVSVFKQSSFPAPPVPIKPPE